MAKLSAYGQKEIARLEKVTEGDVGMTDWQRRTYAFMSNGRVLSKQDVRFKDTGLVKAEKHSYGWKVSPLKFPTEAERADAIARLKAKGYVEVVA